MEEKIKKILKEPQTINYLIIILIGILILLPLFNVGAIIAHDAVYHISKAIGTVLAIKEGQILPYVTQNFANGFGYSWNLFYPPLTTYFIIFFRIFTNSYVAADKLLVIISMILSGIFMYKLMKNISKSNEISLMAAVIYMTVPYRLVDIYTRMALGEVVSFVFVPLVLLGLYSIIYDNGKDNKLLVIGAVGLALTHNISTLLVAIISILYILFNMKKVLKSKHIIKNIFIDIIFICGMILFFYGPMIEAKKSATYKVFENGMMGSLESMHQNSVYFSQIVWGKMQNGISASLQDPNNINQDMCFAIGLQILIPLIFTPYAYKQVSKEKRGLYLSTLIIGIFCILLTSNIFPWKWMPKIFAFVQFPYRFLFIAITLLSCIAAVNIEKVCIKINKRTLMLIISLIFIYIYPLINMATLDLNFDEKIFSQIDKINENTENTAACAYFEYLPTKANIKYISNRENIALILEGNTEIISQEKNGSKMIITLKNTMQDTKIELPYIYYVGYQAKLNNNEIVELKESENGFLEIDLPQNTEGTIELKYTGTLIQKITVLISTITFIIFIIYSKKY